MMHCSRLWPMVCISFRSRFSVSHDTDFPPLNSFNIVFSFFRNDVDKRLQQYNKLLAVVLTRRMFATFKSFALAMRVKCSLPFSLRIHSSILGINWYGSSEEIICVSSFLEIYFARNNSLKRTLFSFPSDINRGLKMNGSYQLQKRNTWKGIYKWQICCLLWLCTFTRVICFVTGKCLLWPRNTALLSPGERCTHCQVIIYLYRFYYKSWVDCCLYFILFNASRLLVGGFSYWGGEYSTTSSVESKE